MARSKRGRADERLITFRLRTLDQPTELRGDFWHFYHATALTPQRSGCQEATLRLPPGVYSYKFRAPDGAWHLDPENGRTRSVGGLRNSLLSVGGTEEPVMHAPARPFLYEGEDGRIWVRAGLRRGAVAGEALSVRLFEEGALDVPMRQVAAEDEHLLFEAALPASRRVLEYVFVLPDGRAVGAPGGAGQALRIARSALCVPAPAWWRDAVIYTIFVDRFRRGEGAAPLRPPPPLPLDGQVPRVFYVPPERLPYGGDLHGVIAALPYLCELGVTALHLTPIGRSPSAHRYDAIDPRAVDPALGGQEALAALLRRAHELGLRVLLDMVLTHVHRDFFAFADVRERGQASPYWDWFRVRRHPFIDGPDPGYDHYQKGQWQEPLLNLESDEVIDHLAETFAGYAALGVDGFRVDAAADVPLPALRRIREAVERPGLVLFGEVIPDSTCRYTDGALHAATDFALQGAVRAWLLGRAGVLQVAEVMARRRFSRGGPGWIGIGFCATHDQHRLLSLCADPRVSRLAHLLLFVRPEVPALYYGDEVGLRCTEPLRDFEDAWPDRQPMPWDPAAWDEETLALVRAAARLRREVETLRRGDEEAVPIKEAGVLVVRRVLGDEIVEAYLHGGEGRVVVPLLGAAPSGAAALLVLGEAEVADGQVALGPWAGLVVRRELPPQGAALWGALVGNNRALCDEAFRRGLTAHPGLPAHLYLTVTEACNLRCRHCITDAPARTADGRARGMQPWVVEALGGALAAAEYFGFAHGGESLVAPIFWDLLAAIRRARAGRRYDVHLLSNGMLLREGVVRRLIDLGVSSLAVSLDGASAGTNDEVRAGARFGEIVANVAGAVRLRQALGADLRIGISTVVMAQNVGEMAALGRLCRELGVDWIKIEELFVVNGFCRRSLLAPSARAVGEGVAALREEAGPGIVIVDHLAAPAGCRCEGDEAARAFRDADDFANRARFHPCSMAFEQACVDPDGTVRPVDYYHQPLGNLAQAPFPDLWNGEVARRLRAQALRRVPIDRRLRCQRG